MRIFKNTAAWSVLLDNLLELVWADSLKSLVFHQLAGHYNRQPRLRIIDSKENKPKTLLERTTERWTPDNKKMNQKKELRNEEAVARSNYLLKNKLQLNNLEFWGPWVAQ